jgi:long-chain fatty acid transport protein
VNDRFSIGAGVSYQDFEAELTRKRVLGLGPAGEGSQELDADDDGWGWNIGALFNVGDDMRIGASYRSSIDYELEGTAKVFLGSGALFTSFPVQADVELPDSASLSVVQAFGPKWELLGDVTWTHWSTIDAIRVVNTVTGTVAETLRLDFDDAWRLSFGVNYKHSDRWTFKGGVAWDQSPVEDATRTVNLPDNDRLWLSIGAKWRMSKSAALDVGYSHLFISDASIDQDLNDPATRGRVVGDYSGYVDILSAQITFAF